MNQENDSPLFSRPTAARAEKLTIVAPVSIRFTETQLRSLDKLAELNNMERGEYIRHLVFQDEDKERRIWAARDQLFSSDKLGATTTSSDSVGQAA